MAGIDSGKFLEQLLATTTPRDLTVLLNALGDRPGLALSESFGPYNLKWVSFGGKQLNISSTNLATKPGRALAERITNGIDALLEERAQGRDTLPKSAREASQKWFGRPDRIDDEREARWYEAQGWDRRVTVSILPGGEEGAPTIDVIDTGIGITPDRMPETILSLQEGNKISKFYQIGLFGQGGSATLGFCDYAVVVSRHRNDEEHVGFTVIKLLELNEDYKEDCFAYLVDGNGQGDRILRASRNGAFRLQGGSDKTLIELRHGTIVRHLGMRLPGLTSALQATPGNLYHYLHAVMFDPLVPFRLMDLRDGDAIKHKNELVAGARSRLLAKSTDVPSIEASDDAGTSVRHFREMEYMAPAGTTVPTIGIEYWVVFSNRKRKDKVELRAQSSEVFVQRNLPIVLTLNGQSHGELGPGVIREAGFPFLSKHMVIHVDATLADKRTRRALFSSTREGLKDSPEAVSIIEYLKNMLHEDTRLDEIERELADRLAKVESKEAEAEVQSAVQKLLREAGIEISESAQTEVAGDGPDGTPARERGRAKSTRPPLSTLPYPQVTRFEIVWPAPQIIVRLGEAQGLLIETDADHEYDRQQRIALRFEGQGIELAGKGSLKGGRIWFRVRATGPEAVGQTGRAIASLTRPDGQQLTSAVDYSILAPEQRKTRKALSRVPPFKIVEIDPDHERWGEVWPQVPSDVKSEYERVAYKAIPARNLTIVFYSSAFRPYKETMEKLSLQTAGRKEMFAIQYKIWIAYHAIIQQSHASETNYGIPEDDRERLQDIERRAVAEMQVRQALRTVEIMERLRRSEP